MKDAVLTVRLPAATRRRIETLARREGRSLSTQVERLLDQALADEATTTGRARGDRPLAGCLHGGLVPTLEDFRAVRAQLSGSLLRRTRPNAQRGR